MSIFSKIYSRINFMNKPSTSTALGATNLNKMDSAINELDNRIVTLDTTKLNLSVANSMVKDLLFDANTGKLTVVFLDGTKKPYDTSLEKIAVNFRYDADTQKLIIVLDDGTEQTVDLSALVTQYEFVDSDTIGFIILENGTVSANIKDGSITEDKLQPNYLADVKAETTKAESASSSAQTYSNDAVYNAQLAQSYAVGGSGIREDETDNAKYYYEQAKGIATGDTATSTVSFTSEDATNPTEYTNVDLLASGETHASLFNKVSTMFKNVRYLFKMLGTTDISAIGDGTTTGAINTLNNNKQNTLPDTLTFASTGITTKVNDGGYTIINDNYKWRLHANGDTFWLHQFDLDGNISKYYTFKDGNFTIAGGDVIDGSGNKLSAKQNTLEVTTGGATRNTTYTTNGSATWRKYGRLVIVDLYDLSLPAITTGDQKTNILFTGLPRAALSGITTLCPFNSDNGGLRVGIDKNSTNIVVWWQTKNGATSGYSGQLKYFTVESIVG